MPGFEGDYHGRAEVLTFLGKAFEETGMELHSELFARCHAGVFAVGPGRHCTRTAIRCTALLATTSLIAVIQVDPRGPSGTMPDEVRQQRGPRHERGVSPFRTQLTERTTIQPGAPPARDRRAP